MGRKKWRTFREGYVIAVKDRYIVAGSAQELCRSIFDARIFPEKDLDKIKKLAEFFFGDKYRVLRVDQIIIMNVENAEDENESKGLNSDSEEG